MAFKVHNYATTWYSSRYGVHPKVAIVFRSSNKSEPTRHIDSSLVVYHLQMAVHVAGGVAAVAYVALAQLAARLRARYAVEVRPNPAAPELLSRTVGWKW